MSHCNTCHGALVIDPKGVAPDLRGMSICA
jgi:mono/diheme cytochrome c family protein